MVGGGGGEELDLEVVEEVPDEHSKLGQEWAGRRPPALVRVHHYAH